MIGGLLVSEVAGYVARWQERGDKYRAALSMARALSRPLIIIGAPDRHFTGTVIASPYGCGQPEFGDLVLDLGPSRCPNAHRWDLRNGMPFADDSVVVFESCVLEYIDGGQVGQIQRELERVSGAHLFQVRVGPYVVAHLLSDARVVPPLRSVQ